MVIDKAFWEGKKILITGHTGFKGGWLCLWLQTMGAEIVGYALQPPTKPNLFEIACVGDGMTSVIGDVRDLTHLMRIFHEHRPEIVIHMAAQPLVRYSYENPVETYSTNIMGTVNILECVRKSDNVHVIVNVTSDKCYENREWIWGYRENEPMGGYDPYSSSKGCAELVTSAYRNSYFNASAYSKHGVAVASARAGNVIGGGDWAPDRLVPDILRALEIGETIKIRNPRAIRPWQHVLEPLAGYLALAQKLHSDGQEFSGGWNFGPLEEDTKSVQWIVEYITRIWDKNASWLSDASAHPHEAHHLKLDCSKAKSMLCWKPRWDLEKALSSIVAWHRAYQAQCDMRTETIRQINDYVSGAT